MMNYQEFRDEVKKNIGMYLNTSGMENTKVEIETVQKVNKKLEGLKFVTENSKVCPTYYMDNLYKDYLSNGNFDLTMVELIEKLKFSEMERPDFDLDFNKIKDKVILELVNSENNKGLLENIPHRNIADLSVIYRWIIDANNYGITSAIVTNQVAEEINLSENDLFKSASENLKKTSPATIKSLEEVVMGIMNDQPEKNDQGIEIDDPDSIYVTSNTRKQYGAAAILDTELMSNIAEQMDSNIYILPSSIHECLLVSDRFGEPEQLQQMVREVNSTEVDIKDKLSDNLYVFNKDTKKIEIAVDDKEQKQFIDMRRGR